MAIKSNPKYFEDYDINGDGILDVRDAVKWVSTGRNDIAEMISSFVTGQQPMPSRRPIPTQQDCQEERQFLQETFQLSSLEEILSTLEEYTRNNEPCISIGPNRDKNI